MPSSPCKLDGAERRHAAHRRDRPPRGEGPATRVRPDRQRYAPREPRHGVPGVFFFNDTATTEIYTLSLHDALPISEPEVRRGGRRWRRRWRWWRWWRRRRCDVER